MAGFAQGGGVGLALANWMTEGDPGFDVFAMDVARFGAYATPAFTNARVRQNYARRFSIRFPNEELPAARPLLTSPIYDLLKAEGCQFGEARGLEVPLWFAPEGVRDEFSWRRSTDFDHVGAEARAVREGVGILEITGFAKYRVTGAAAAAWLDRILAARVPEVGRMVLAPMLKEDGRLIGDFTLARLAPEEFLIAGSGCRRRLPHALVPAAPRRRGLRRRAGTVAHRGVDRRTEVAGGSRCGRGRRCLRRGVPVHGHPADARRHGALHRRAHQLHRRSRLRDLDGARNTSATSTPALKEAGAAHGIRDFGLRALNALRLEKGWGGWAREYRPVYSPWEAGLDRYVALGKDADFIGKAGGAGDARQRPDATAHLHASRRATPTSSATSRSGRRARSWAG